MLTSFRILHHFTNIHHGFGSCDGDFHLFNPEYATGLNNIQDSDYQNVIIQMLCTVPSSEKTSCKTSTDVQNVKPRMPRDASECQGKVSLLEADVEEISYR